MKIDNVKAFGEFCYKINIILDLAENSKLINRVFDLDLKNSNGKILFPTRQMRNIISADL